MIAPAVPVTVKVTWDPAAGVWAFEEPPHPTANSENIETTSNKPKPPLARRALRVSGFRLRDVKTVPNSPRAGSRLTRDAAW